jgi:hypothetical protein
MFFFNYNVLAGKQLQPRITICFIAYSSQKEQCVLPGARKSSICAPGPEHAKKKKMWRNTQIRQPTDLRILLWHKRFACLCMPPHGAVAAQARPG